MIDARLTESWQHQHWTNVLFGQLLAQFGLHLMLHFHCILSVSCSWGLCLKILTRGNLAKKTSKMAFRQILTRSIHTTRAMQMSGGAHGEESEWFFILILLIICTKISHHFTYLIYAIFQSDTLPCYDCRSQRGTWAGLFEVLSFEANHRICHILLTPGHIVNLGFRH